MKRTVRDRSKLLAAFLVVLIAAMDPAIAQEDRSSNLTMEALTNWLDAYGDAWEKRDAMAAAALFSDDASYRVTPYKEPHLGRESITEYWATVTEGQRNVRFQYESLSVSGNTGIAHWSAKFDVEPDGGSFALDGIFVLDFDENGRCRVLREWWHVNAEGG
jgi:ketosteroid isomerase-like protein